MAVRAILNNEIACPAMTYVGPLFADELEAEEWALRWFGDPRRKRSFVSMLVESNGSTREVVRGVS